LQPLHGQTQALTVGARHCQRVREALRSVETADALFELIISEDARL
jgi:hypothetical protein